MFVVKKDGTLDPYNPQKIKVAITKSAKRVMIELTEQDKNQIVECVESTLNNIGEDKVSIQSMHNLVESALETLNPKVAKSYRDYRNYKQDFVHMMDEVFEASQHIRFIGDKENSNTDSALVATKRCLVFNELNKRLYRKFFMTKDELQACKEGYIYVHDQSARLDTMNCFERSTRFITDRGVKSFYDFTDGDEVRVISHKGVWRKATIHSYGWQNIQKVTFKRGSGKEKQVLVTPDHRWILKDGTETTNLKVGDRLIATPDVTQFDWEDLTREEKKLWCLGFSFADGSVVKDNKIPTMHLRLCGRKKLYASRFNDVGYSVTSPNSFNGDLEVRMTDIHSKDLPFLQLNYSNVLYFMNGYLCADGNRNLNFNSSSEFRGVQVSGDFNEYIYDLLNIAGYYVTNTTDLTGQTTNYGIRTKETKSYQIYSNCGDKTWVVKSIEPTKLNPKAQVWCLEVEEDHSFLLENGIPTGNCCLADIGSIMSGGFEMGNLWYNEPKTLETCFDVIGDIILSSASQQYGGFTVPEIDKILAPYAQKSYDNYVKEYNEDAEELINELHLTYVKGIFKPIIDHLAHKKAMKKVKRDFEQGFQGIEYKLNTVGSSRGDYPFVTMTLGLDTSDFGKMASITFLQVHKEGQGKKGFKKPVLFPKLVFLYDEELHGKGKPLNDVFEAGIDCSCETMYPDWLSLTGEGYVPSIYKKYKKVISPMGCRAFLSPYYERGGFEPADENDTPIFVGRFNIGAVSLHLPMILAKARRENKDFYEVLDYYLEMIRQIHCRTYEYLGEMKASVNPVMFCEGGFYGGHLKPNEKIKPILKSATASFGFTALNELQYLYNGKSLREDGQFALEVLQYINDKITDFKKEDNHLYAMYGTPAESLCGLQVEQFRKEFGIIEHVSDKPYVSNSFHCHVSEDISPIEKQDKEERFWNLANGGKIQYVRYPQKYNKLAFKTLILRAMKKGFYEGANLALSYCDDCGHQELEMDVCPCCGSDNLTKIDRMNGYLSFSRIKGSTRLNSAKMFEIKDRVSM